MAERVLQGRFQISTVNDVTPGSEWQCVGLFADIYAKFTAPNVEAVFNAGDTVYIYVMSPTYGNVDRFRVTAVNSATVTNDLDVNVVYDEDTPMANPVGRPLPGNTLIAKASENLATMTPVMISASLDERLYNYARNLNDKLVDGGYTNEKFVLTATDISNKYIELSGEVNNVADTIVLIAGAPIQFYGDDYTVTSSPARVSWNALGLDGVLSDGDKITVIYK